MSVTAPPRPPRRSIVVDPDELAALVEALIEEARQRARRRRRRRGALAALAVIAGVGLYLALDHGGRSTSAAPASGGGFAAAARTGERWGAVHGPDGGPADAIAVAPSAPHVAYLGTQRGVFRSTNGGRSWVSAGPGGYLIPGVTSLVVDPRSAATVYAGTNWRWAGGMSFHQAVIKTANGGRTWRTLALHGEPIATTRAAVYALTGGLRKTYRLVSSTDGGRSWEPADGGLPPTYVWGLASDPSAPAAMYAAMGKRGVFASSDGGVHWRAARGSARYGEATAVAVDPLRPRTVYAATHAGIIGSDDGARSWRLLNASIRERGTVRWYGQVSALLVDPRDSNTVYASTRCAGVFKSTDGGRRWSSANVGLASQCPSAYSLALDPRAPRTIYAADPVRGVVKSVDGAATWSVKNTGLDLAPVWSLGVDAQSPQTVYASTGALGLFKSVDGGVHWRPLATGLRGGAYSVAVDPNDSVNVIVGSSWARSRFGSLVPSNDIATSTDAGRRWSTARFGGRSVSAVAISGTTAYAGSDVGDGVFGSTDGGHSWHALGPAGVIYTTTLAVDPANADVVYVGVMGKTHGLYTSADGGKSWRRLDALDLDVTAVALDPDDPSTIYVVANDRAGGILKSTDSGATWQQVNSGLGRRLLGRHKNPNLTINALAIDPAHPATLYAATDTRGVFRSTDAGRSWRPLNGGLAGRTVTTFAVAASGRAVYAAIDGGGIVTLRPSS